MLFTEEKIQIGILAGVPFRPAMLPIRPPAIAGEFIEHTDGASLAGPCLRIKDKFGPAVRACCYCVGCIAHDSLWPQFHPLRNFQRSPAPWCSSHFVWIERLRCHPCAVIDGSRSDPKVAYFRLDVRLFHDAPTGAPGVFVVTQFAGFHDQDFAATGIVLA